MRTKQFPESRVQLSVLFSGFILTGLCAVSREVDAPAASPEEAEMFLY